MSNEQFERHIGRKIPIEIINSEGQKDIFYFKKINLIQLAALLDVAKKFGKDKELDTSKLDKEDLVKIQELLANMVRESYPEINSEIANDFVSENFEKLFESLDKLMPQVDSETTKKFLEEVKKKQHETN